MSHSSIFSRAHECSVMILFLVAICFAGIQQQRPRVYVNSGMVSELRVVIENENSLQYRLFRKVRDKDHPLVDAFKFLVFNDTVSGSRAINNALIELKRCDDARRIGPFQYGACVYDWCYSLLSKTQKEMYVAEFTRIANLAGPYYPAKSEGHFVASHNNEGWLLSGQIPVGIAIYNENRVMLDSALKVFEQKYVPVSNFYYKSHMHHQGDSYIGTRFYHELLASQTLETAFNRRFYSQEQGLVPYQVVYHSRPDRLQLKSGDSYNCMGNTSKGTILTTAGFMYNDPILVSFGFDEYFKTISPFQEIIGILVSINSSVESLGEQLSNLPKAKYFPSPQGEIIWRTDWAMDNEKSNSPVIQMRIGEYFFGNHQKRDLGTFQIYYKGALAINTGFYGIYNEDHWLNYHHETISTNGLLIYDPQEQNPSWNSNRLISGGQYLRKTPKDIDGLIHDNKVGDIASRYISDDYELAYISGDITSAYTSKVSEVTRSMVSVKTDDAERPAVFFIFDRVTSAQPEFKKTWLMHSLQEPVLDDNRMTIVNNRPYYNSKGDFDSDKGFYSGKLVSECLLPENPQIRKVGGPGREFWVEQGNRNVEPSRSSIQVYGRDTIPAAFESGSWRIEVSPGNAQKRDLFLHAMAVMEDDTELEQRARLIESDKMYGAALLGKAVLFSKDTLLSDDIAVDFGSSKYDLLLTDLAPGNWTFSTDDFTYVIAVSDTSNSAYIKGVTGAFRAAPSLGSGIPVPTEISGEKRTDSHFGFKTRKALMTNDGVYFTYKISASDLSGLNRKEKVKVEVFDNFGRKVNTLENGILKPGTHQLFWKGTNSRNRAVSRGVYFVRLVCSQSEDVMKVIKQ